MKGLWRIPAVAFLLASAAQAYYHFTHFVVQDGTLRAILEKFDVNVLPGRTLPFYVADPASVHLGANDSFPALLSHIRSAAQVWNDVETSDLRLSFGGIMTGQTPVSTTSVDVLFEEVPPGIVAMGGPTIRAESNGVFVPIVKSVVIIQPDLTNRPSYTESFFQTLVHEFGHALGLQHTFTSSVMSTATTRSTSKARPLTTDDVAAISILYPRASFLEKTGTITGRVTMNGNGVNLASVVAIAPNGAAVSALTNPDGTYRIEGLPPRGYYVYVHPLPPPRQGQTTPGDIVYPVDQDGKPLPESGTFETVFYASFAAGGVKDPSVATPVAAAAGQATENINFAVRPRSGYGIHSVETIAYPGEFGVKPPYLSAGMLRPFVIATGSGLISGSGPVPGLTVNVLGGAGLTVRPLSTAPSTWIQILFNPQNLLVSSESARHLVFSAGNDIYVLPSAFFHVERQPPLISGVVTGSDPQTAVITGTNLTPGTRYLFDGIAAQVRGGLEETSDGIRATVVPPQAAPGHTAVVTALNPDGQSSLFLQNQEPPVYTYPAESSTVSAMTFTPNTLPSGVEATVQIDAPGAQFAPGQVSVSFGTTDVSLRRLWVVSPTRLLLNVAVSGGAQLSIPTVTVISGLQITQQAASFVLQGTIPRPFWLSSLYVNASTGQPSVRAGNNVTMLATGAPVAITTNNTSVLVNDVRVPLLGINAGQVTFQIPASTPAGPLTVRIETAGERSLPVTIPVQVAVARILAASSATGDLVALSVAGLTDENVTVMVGDRAGKLIAVLPDGDKHSVIFQLPENLKNGETVPVTLVTSAGTSDPFSLKIGG